MTDVHPAPTDDTDSEAVRPSPPAPTGSAADARRALLSSSIGSVVEWYSFLSFGTASALVLGDLFFPSGSPLVATLAALSAFALGEFARPLGGVVFGHFGDRYGRRSVLMLTMLLMGVSSFAIGLLPTYAAIGVAAPILLGLLRVVQGIAIGGEWGGAALMAVEHAPARRRGFWGSISQLGSAGGLLLSTAVFSLLATMPEYRFLAWGWRVPFLLGIALAAVGLFIRHRTTETPVFEAVDHEVPRPLVSALRLHWRRVLLGAGMTVGLGAQMILVVWVASYAVEIGYDQSTVLTALMIMAAVQFIALPALGATADRVGRKPIYVVGSLLLGANGFLELALVNTGQDVLLVVAFVLGTVLFCVIFSQSSALLAELFPTGSRYTAMSLAYQTGSLIGSGLGPVSAASLLVAAGGPPHTLLVSTFIAALCLVSAACALAVPETSRSDLRSQQTPST